MNNFLAESISIQVSTLKVTLEPNTISKLNTAKLQALKYNLGSSAPHGQIVFSVKHSYRRSDGAIMSTRPSEHKNTYTIHSQTYTHTYIHCIKNEARLHDEN